MSNKLNINVSGGNAAFGNVVQGDRNTVTGHASVSVAVEQQYQASHAAIAETAATLKISAADLDAALLQLAALKQRAAESTPKADEGKGILKFVKDNFGWAYPAVKDFAKIAWPALLVAIGL